MGLVHDGTITQTLRALLQPRGLKTDRGCYLKGGSYQSPRDVELVFHEKNPRFLSMLTPSLVLTQPPQLNTAVFNPP